MPIAPRRRRPPVAPIHACLALAFGVLLGAAPARAQDHGDHDTIAIGDAARSASLHLFGNVDFTRAPNGVTGFALGQFDLFGAAQISEGVQLLAEAVVEGDDTGQYAIDMERLLLTYDVHSRLRVSAGRYHTTIGYYNTAYHHGVWFQTAATRPIAFRFEDEGGILPVHGVGVAAGGALPWEGAGLRWTAEIGNGRGPDSNAVQNIGDADRGKSVNLALTARPASWPGTQLGVSVLNDRFNTRQGDAIHEQLVSMHAVWLRHPLEWLNEAVWVFNARAGEDATTSQAGYVQVAYAWRRLRPFGRFDWQRTPSGDPIFLGAHVTARTAGLRCELGPSSAVKLQVDHERRDATTGVRAIGQVAFAF